MRHILISLLLGSVPGGGGGGEAFSPALFPLLTFNTKGPFIFYQVGGRIADGIEGGGTMGGGGGRAPKKTFKFCHQNAKKKRFLHSKN